MLFQFPQYREVNQLHTHMYPFPFRFPSYLGHHRPPEKAMGTRLQYSRLENPLDGGAWWAAVHGVAKSQTRLSNFTLVFTFML